jgi:regulator of sigma E protease
MNILIFIIILVVLVVSHEFGHFIVAKLNKIRVDEFAFGFPPRLFKIKKGETTYSFNALPLGGYVKIYGENVDEADMLEVGFLDKEETPEKVEMAKRSMANKPKYIQAAVLFAGIAMNLLVAWILLSIGFMSGLPTSVGSVPKGAIIEDQALTITSVVSGSPAEIGGLKTGDKIISLDTPTDSTKLLSSILGTESIQNFVKKHDGEEISVSLIRGKEPIEVTVIPEKKDLGGTPMIGISMDMIGTLKLPLHKAIWEGAKLTWDVTKATVVGFYTLIRDAFLGKANMDSLTGPIGIVGVVGDAAKFGFIYLLSFTALISVNLAVINLVPFPALDGGRLLFLLIEKIKGSRIKPKVANMANAIGFGLLMLLMAVITFHDIVKLL